MHHRLMVGLSGMLLTADEKEMLRTTPPRGVILFARNIDNREQLYALIENIRQATGEDTWVAIDEEGGRIHRIPWAPFSGRKTAAEWGIMLDHNNITAINAIYEDACVVGEALASLGFSHNCAPVLDLFNPQADPIIGNRAYGKNVDDIFMLACAVMDGLHDSGIEAVGKHFPGHGRANTDSHLACPIVDVSSEQLQLESKPFATMVERGLRHIMTAHVSYPAVDAKITTFSKTWLQEKLRCDYAFDGVIWSDDLCMKGAGDDLQTACERAIAAGCDLLLVCEPGAAQKLFSLQA
ncbi:MAG: beta-N-acetylhexosaminidase [Mariprofundaceae bacterium]